MTTEPDIVERLRERHWLWLAGCELPPDSAEQSNFSAAADEIERLVKALEEETDVWRDLIERAHHLAVCVFKGSTKADYERARHNAAVLANAIDHARQNERNRAALRSHRGEKP